MSGRRGKQRVKYGRQSKIRNTEANQDVNKLAGKQIKHLNTMAATNYVDVYLNLPRQRERERGLVIHIHVFIHLHVYTNSEAPTSRA